MPGIVALHETLSAGGVRVPHRMLGIQRSYKIHDLRTARYLAKHSDRFDVVHTWPRAAARTLQTARSLTIAGVREAPNTHTANAFAVDDTVRQSLGLSVPHGHSHKYDEHILAREELEYARAHMILVASKWALETFLARDVPSARVAYRPYGVDVAVFSRAEARPQPEAARVAFVGRGEPRKGLHIALEAWHASGAAESAQLLIAGTIEPEYRHLLAVALDHPSIVELGFVTDVADLLAQSDILLLPSLEEGSALVTYEAQACGCALLVSHAAGAAMTEGREGLMHRPGDKDALTSHLRRLLNNRDALRAMQSAAASNARQLTWSNSIARQLEIYDRTLRSLPRGRHPVS